MLKKISMFAFALLCALPVLGPHIAKAAADADLVAGLASSSAIYTDNKSTLIGYVVGLILVTTVIALVIRALFFGKRQITGVFGGGRRKR